MLVRRICAAAVFVTVLVTAGPRLWPGLRGPVSTPSGNQVHKGFHSGQLPREPGAPAPPEQFRAAPLRREWRDAIRTGIAPRQTKHVNPVYPEAARQAHIEGTVLLELLLDEGGRVRDVRVLRSIPLLDQAAIDAVRQWEFTPTLVEERAVKVVMSATVSFAISE